MRSLAPLYPLGRPWRDAMNRCPYVTDGLVAWFDPLTCFRDGVGRHALEAVGSPVVSREAIKTERGFVMLTDNGIAGWIRSGITVEVEATIHSYSGDGHALVYSGALNSFSTRQFGVLQSDKTGSCLDIAQYCASGWMSAMFFDSTVPGFGAHSVCMVANGAALVVRVDGSQKERLASGGTTPTESRICFGGGYGANRFLKATIRSIRVYSRALTNAEVAANYAADKERFGLP